ncbi:unnamed protein product [Sphenostylis stenocarpa]|uniref:Uncharacterized protein n=1 Tax=Sphenostylis stenocarpa TaxID=92480 RepID=A0AA86S1J1_9FABA|nr:unnamed protein product [Sphenostylis stenocarpa]
MEMDKRSEARRERSVRRRGATYSNTTLERRKRIKKSSDSSVRLCPAWHFLDKRRASTRGNNLLRTTHGVCRVVKKWDEIKA